MNLKNDKALQRNLSIPDYQNLIQNLITECNVCNQAKTEHRKTSLLFKTTPETAFCREIYVADIYTIKNQNYLTCIDLYSKYGTAIELNAKDWMEVKRGLFRIFNSMGKPRTLKTDRDSAFMSIALKNWLDTEDVNIQITTSKNGVSDVERLHKTINEEIRETENSDNTENKLMKMEVIQYSYNHKIKPNATGRTPADVCFMQVPLHIITKL